MELLDCVLRGVCVVIRSDTVVICEFSKLKVVITLNIWIADTITPYCDCPKTFHLPTW